MSRSRIVRRCLALGLGLPFLAIAAARAETTVIGNPIQTSNQGSNLSQTANNIVKPLPVVGPNHSSSSQTAVTSLGDGEVIAPTGGSVLGNSAQASDQAGNTTQLDVGSKTMTNTAIGSLSNGQFVGADVILGDTGQTNLQGDNLSQTLTGSKVATDTIASLLGNSQIIGDGTSVIIGATGQRSAQADNTAQGVSQKASNPTIGNSTLKANSTTIAIQDNGQHVAATTIIGTSGQTASQGHNGTQSTQQVRAPVTTGNYAPIDNTVNFVDQHNCQTIKDGSVTCLLFP